MPGPGEAKAFFAYGTLQLPEVMIRVVGRTFLSEPALLEGYARLCIRGETFPGLIEAPGRRTRGSLYAGIDPSALERLDRFEDDFYERREVRVRTNDGEDRAAETYVVPKAMAHVLSQEPWDETQFRSKHLSAFLSDRSLRGLDPDR